MEAPKSNFLSYKNGMHLVVQNQTWSNDKSLFGGINVSPGSETYIGVSRKFISKQPAPYSNCLSDLKPFSAYSEKIFAYFSKLGVDYYDQQLCIDLCYQDKLISTCTCIGLVTDSTPFGNTTFCDTKSLTRERQFDTVFTSSDPILICENACQPQCETQTFTYSRSASKYPSSFY